MPSVEETRTFSESGTFWHNNAPLHLKAALYAVVGFHMAIIFGNVAALFVLPFFAPWYVSLPVVSLLINFMFSAVPCPLTRIESLIRSRMGLPEIRYFIQHYFFRPSWRKPRRVGC